MAGRGEDRVLSMLTQLLRVRLAHRAIMDVNIIGKEAFLSSGKLDDHHGRFLGCFIRRGNFDDGAICFLFFIRSKEGGHFDVAYAFYVNSNLYRIPESEKFWFNTRASLLHGVFILKADVPRAYYPSILLEGVESNLGLRYATNFSRRIVVHLQSYITFYRPNSSVDVPSCNIVTIAPEVESYWTKLKNKGLVCIDHNCQGEKAVSGPFDVMCARFKGHFYYCVLHKEDDLMVVYICHDALLKTTKDVRLFDLLLSRALGPLKPGRMEPCRLKLAENVTCSSKQILQACAKFRSFPMRHPRA